MSKKDVDCLNRAVAVIRRLNTNDSQWLNETADSVENIAKSYFALNLVKKKQNRAVPVLTAATTQGGSSLSTQRSHPIPASPEFQDSCEHVWTEDGIVGHCVKCGMKVADSIIQRRL